MMKWALIVALFTGCCYAQQPVINDFTPEIKGATIGPVHCYFWAQYPVAGQLQMACYDQNGTVVQNQVVSFATMVSSVGSVNFGVGAITWILSPGTGTAIRYQICATTWTPVSGMPSTVQETGVF